MARKSAKVAKKAAAKQVAAKSTKPRKTAPKSQSRKTAKPALLAGGNPLIAKGKGDAPVQAYIAAMPGWKREVGSRLDALIVRTVPGVHKAVKWNSPLYGIEGQEKKKAGFSASMSSRSTSKWLSSAARRCVLCPPASPSRGTCATSTYVRTTSSTKLNSPLG